MPRSPSRADGQYLVTAEITPQLLAAVTSWCAARGVLADGLTVERRSLEEVFLALTAADRRPEVRL